MADSFLDPATQAQFNELVAALRSEIGATEALLTRAQAATAELETAARRAGATAPGQTAPRSGAAAREPAIVEQTTTAVRGTVGAQSELNAQIVTTIELRTRELALTREIAASAKGLAAGQASVARDPAVAGQAGAGAGAAAPELEAELGAEKQITAELDTQLTLRERSLAMLKELRQQGGLGFQGTGSLQQTINALERSGTTAPDPSGAPVPVPVGGSGSDQIGKTAGATRELNAAQQAHLAIAHQAADAERGIGTAAEYEARMVSIADQSWSAHGALSTEWLTGLARGQVTLRSFGEQISQTIGKFAGWTAAAGAVYGVIAAVQKLGEGAINGLGGVRNLQRTIENLDTRRAGDQITELARNTVTPMKDAGDAVFLFSRTFHNLDDATYVAGLALRAFTLDGVSLTDQVKAATAIHQQFGVTAQGLGPIWGLLANGQREFNARVNEMIPALGGSAAAIHNAGGNLEDYIKILQVALRQTQLTGPQLATAFRRAPTFLAKPKDQEVLQQLGFDPQAALSNITDFFKQVMARAPEMLGEDRRKLFTAVFGPQLGQRLAPLGIVDPNLVKQVFAQQPSVKPLMDEFATAIGTPKKQLEELGVSLETLGSRLAQSGLLGGLGLVVHGLQLGLDVSNDILKVFDQLPGPLKTAAGILATLKVGDLLLGRFPGGAGQGGISGAIGNVNQAVRPQYTQQKALERALQDEQGYYVGLEQAATQRTLRLKNQIQAAGNLTAAMREQGATDAQLGEQGKRIESLDEQLLRAQYEQREALEAQIITEQQITGLRALIRQGLSVEQAALKLGITQTVPIERGVVGASPIPIGGTAAVPVAAARASAAPTVQNYGLAAGVLPVVATEGVAAAAAAAAARAAAPTDTETVSIGRWARIKALWAQQVALEGEAMAAAGTAGLGVRAATTAASTEALSEDLPAAGSALGRLGGAARLLIGPLFAIGLTAGSEIDTFDQVSQASKQAHDAFAQLPQSMQQAQQDMQTVQDAAKKSFDLTGGAGTLGGIVHGIPLIGPLVTKAAVGIQTLTGFSQQQQLLQNTPQGPTLAALQQLSAPITTQTVREPAGTTNLGLGITVPAYRDVKVSVGGEYTMLLKRAQDDAKTIADTEKGRAQWAAEMAGFERILNLARTRAETRTPKATQDIEAVFAGYSASLEQIDAGFRTGQTILGNTTRSVLSSLKEMFAGGKGGADIVNAMQGLSDHLKIYGFDTGSFRKLAGAYEFLAAQYATSVNPKDMQLVSQAQTALLDAVQGSVQNLIAASEVASSKRQRLSLLSQARALVHAAESVVKSGSAAQTRAIEGAITANEALIKTYLETISISVAAAQVMGKSGQAAAQAINAAVAVLRGQDHALKQQLAGVNSAIGNIFAGLDQSLKTINTQTTAALKVPKVPKVPQTPASQDPFELTRLRREIEQAQAEGDPVRQAQISEQLAQQEIGAARNEHERLQGQLDLVNAENQYNKAIEDRAQAIFGLKESETTDPIAKARIELAKATQDVQYQAQHGGTDTTAYFDARAKQNDARRNLIDATLQGKEDDIKFHLDMGQISVATAIEQYQALLKMHNLTKAKREEILLAIHQWETQGQSFGDLNLGSIRLPTPYEVRRGLMGQQAGTFTVTQQNTTNIHVYDERGANQVGVAMDRYNSGVGKAIQRATLAR